MEYLKCYNIYIAGCSICLVTSSMVFTEIDIVVSLWYKKSTSIHCILNYANCRYLSASCAIVWIPFCQRSKHVLHLCFHVYMKWGRKKIWNICELFPFAVFCVFRNRTIWLVSCFWLPLLLSILTISGGKQSIWSQPDGFHGLQGLHETKGSMFRSRISNILICHAHVTNKSILWGLLDAC